MIAILEPNGWMCTLEECPPGPLIVLPIKTDQFVGGHLAFKSEYRSAEMKMLAYNEAGEYLCINSDRLVQPVAFKWEDE